MTSDLLDGLKHSIDDAHLRKQWSFVLGLIKVKVPVSLVLNRFLK